MATIVCITTGCCTRNCAVCFIFSVLQFLVFNEGPNEHGNSAPDASGVPRESDGSATAGLHGRLAPRRMQSLGQSLRPLRRSPADGSEWDRAERQKLSERGVLLRTDVHLEWATPAEKLQESYVFLQDIRRWSPMGYHGRCNYRSLQRALKCAMDNFKRMHGSVKPPAWSPCFGTKFLSIPVGCAVLGLASVRPHGPPTKLDSDKFGNSAVD